MTEYESDPASLLDLCREVAASVLKQHRWGLLTHEELAQEMMSVLDSGIMAEPRRAAMYVYSLRLYAACSGQAGSDRQNQAFLELSRYLYQISFHEHITLAPDLRQEAINESLLRIWRRLDQCRKHGAFLVFAAYEMYNVIRPLWRGGTPEDYLEEAEQMPDTRMAGDPLARVISAELRQRVRACFASLIRRCPRAKQQLEAVWLKHIEFLDDATICKYLKKSIGSVYVLRTRGLERLRADPEWRSIARDLDLLED